MIDMLIGMTMGASFVIALSFLHALISTWVKDKKC